ncbi:SPOR domain-containing protein [Verminephrobacter eiseniae]|uniref:SPOR domain-containing protein n=1 Tax=Verminephrobacter eiseniae TaxID=364317 RepID=UPI00223875EB|nr:SPOR domain-containing protein [Verminephrobacter eiseniae]
MNSTQRATQQTQTGGTIVGFIVGVIVGLGIGLAVTVKVTGVPVPFLNKGNGRSADSDAAESRKNRDWDPNSPLYGKNPVRPPAPAASGAAPTASAAEAASAAVQMPSPAAVTAAAPRPAASQPEAKAKAPADSRPGADPFDYFVQAGAFRTQADADTQRAQLAMLGWEARVSEREQNGRAVFRVRIGPFSKRDDAEQLKEKLDSAEVESTLVRVQRQTAPEVELFTRGMAPTPSSKTRPKVFDETP